MARNRCPADVAGLPVATSVPSAVHVAAGAELGVPAPTRGFGHGLKIGLESGRLVACVAEQHRALGRVRPPERPSVRHRPPLVALHAEVLIGVRRRRSGTAAGPRSAARGRILGRAVRVVTDRAGLAQVVGAAGWPLLGVVGGHTPGRQGCLALMARRADGIVGRGSLHLPPAPDARGPTAPTPRRRERPDRCSGCGRRRSFGALARVELRPRDPAGTDVRQRRVARQTWARPAR